MDYIFVKTPLNVFNFYNLNAYNKYYKVEAYGEVQEFDDGYKSVARTLKFVEEYTMDKFFKVINRFHEANNVIDNDSVCVYVSNIVTNSKTIRKSDRFRSF